MKKQSQSLLFLAVMLASACTPTTPEGTGGGTGGAASGSGGARSGTGGSGGTSSAGGSGGTNPGTGGTPVGTGGVPAGTGGSNGSGGAMTGTGGGGGGVDMAAETPAPSGAPGSGLHDQVFKVMCPNSGTGGGCGLGADQKLNDPARSFLQEIEFGGDPSKTYKFTFKVCMVFEYRRYNNCAAMSPNATEICVDGTPVTGRPASTYPALSLKVSEPAHTYYLNRSGGPDTLQKREYMATIDVKGGSKLTVQSDGGDNPNTYTAYNGGAKTCPNVPGIMQPFPGQFIHFQVVSATEM